MIRNPGTGFRDASIVSLPGTLQRVLVKKADVRVAFLYDSHDTEQSARSSLFSTRTPAMAIELVIFDCDGVLVDSEPIANRILAEELTRIGLPTTCAESIRLYMGKSEKDCLNLIADQLGGPPPPDVFENYRSRTETAFAQELKPIDGIRETLKQIPFTKCVASSGSHEKIQTSLLQTGLNSFFTEHIFSSADVERGKPHPDLFLYAAEKMEVTPDNCIVVEDSVPGVTAAATAGMKVYGYAALVTAEQLKSAGAEVFDNMLDLPELLLTCASAF